MQCLFLDLNAFFASCEQQENPALRGQPVIVVQTLTESAVEIAASYAAKGFGIKRDARQLCPAVVPVQANSGSPPQRTRPGGSPALRPRRAAVAQHPPHLSDRQCFCCYGSTFPSCSSLFQLFGAADADFVFARLQTLRNPPAARPNSFAEPANVGFAISELLCMRYRR